MTLTGLIDRMDDWVNPIVVKELRQAVKSRVVTSVLLLFLGVQLLILGMALAFQAPESQGGAGPGIFLVLQSILLGTCMIFIPAYAAGRMRNERSEANVDLLFISTLKPTSIIAGKFFSAMVLAMLVFSCCAPFMTFTYLMRGLDIPSILIVFGIDLLAIILSTQLALFLASVHAASSLKTALFFFAFLMLIYAFGLLVMGTGFLVQGGAASALDLEFWAVMGLITLGVLLATGLLFCWSVALISPPSANRARTGRIFLVASWFLMGIGCLVFSYYLARGPVPFRWKAPVYVWMATSVILFSLQIAISINERESWGPRITRTIPRWGLARLAAFLFYSGSAGGILLSLLGLGLTFGVWSWVNWLDPTSSIEQLRFLHIFGCIALFSYCYGMTALLCRSAFLSKWIPKGSTWLLGLFFLGLGCTVPWLISLLINNRGSYYPQFPWWLLTNPFGSILEMGGWDTNHFYSEICLAFLAIWAALVSLIGTPWAINQFKRFRRSAPRSILKIPEMPPGIPETKTVAPVGAG